MCNSYKLVTGAHQLAEAFSQTRLPLRFPAGVPNLEPRDNIRISERAPIVHLEGEDAVLDMRPWSWKGPAGAPVFNFRSDGRRFPTGRCLIPANSFYEFTGAKSPKTRWECTLQGHDLFAIAGLIRNDAFTMLTCPPGPDVAPYHDRQVVVLAPDLWAPWLQGAPEAGLLAPLPQGSLAVEKRG